MFDPHLLWLYTGAAALLILTPGPDTFLVAATSAADGARAGVLASLGQLCMTRAYSQGPTLVAANLQYSGIVFAAMYGLLLFGDVIPPIGWAGMALIVASGIAATLLTHRAMPDNHEEQR